ncbi:hypothetical protein HD554DRAFT_2041706 [Boletus coccyginus]|nr:hypothetical protein HD554DRAFT_2041706 [Boletus coccyginus]
MERIALFPWHASTVGGTLAGITPSIRNAPQSCWRAMQGNNPVKKGGSRLEKPFDEPTLSYHTTPLLPPLPPTLSYPEHPSSTAPLSVLHRHRQSPVKGSWKVSTVLVIARATTCRLRKSGDRHGVQVGIIRGRLHGPMRTIESTVEPCSHSLLLSERLPLRISEFTTRARNPAHEIGDLWQSLLFESMEFNASKYTDSSQYALSGADVERAGVVWGCLVLMCHGTRRVLDDERQNERGDSVGRMRQATIVHPELGPEVKALIEVFVTFEAVPPLLETLQTACEIASTLSGRPCLIKEPSSMTCESLSVFDKGSVDRAELCPASRLEPSQAGVAIAASSRSPILVQG